MSEFSETDYRVLKQCAESGNRERYWNYLAQHEGSDGYGLLALGVVRNDSMPGAVANSYAQTYAMRAYLVDWKKIDNRVRAIFDQAAASQPGSTTSPATRTSRNRSPPIQ